MTTLLLADHDTRGLSEATIRTLSAARQLGDGVDILVVGQGGDEAAAAAAELEGVSRVLLATDASLHHRLPEDIAALVVGLAGSYSHLVAPASSVGKDVMPRIAALLDVMQLSDIVAVIDPQTFRRPIYAGNALQILRSADPQKVITVRASSFPPTDGRQAPAPIEAVTVSPSLGLSSFVSSEISSGDRPELEGARVVVSGGRGLGSRDGFDALLLPLAEKLGAAIGASRAAVDAGYATNDLQVGQTGKIVAPELYVAVGISGAIQHLAGMKDARVIVAINKDADAPIFQSADYGLVGDLFELVPELARML